MNKDTGDTGEAVSVAGHGIVLKPSSVRVVVRGDPDECR
jgi:hypothetical protein